MWRSRSNNGVSETRSTYGSTTRTSRTSSRPAPSQASPLNIIDDEEDNSNGDDDGDSAKAPVTSTSARCCRSVASAPARPSRSLAPFPAPNYYQSAYTGSWKGKRDSPSSKGGKGASSHLKVVSFRGTFARIAPSGHIIMSGGTKGFGILERALANWPILESTWEGGPTTDLDPQLCKLHGCPPLDDAEYPPPKVWEPDVQSNSSEEWFDPHTEWFDPEEDEDLACYTGYDD